jgi:PHD/YefM family antitoxin component YafN of YafNO toxin-antitoxin module
MQRTMSATEARIHFGELMQHVVEQKEPVIVEHSGKPYVIATLHPETMLTALWSS